MSSGVCVQNRSDKRASRFMGSLACDCYWERVCPTVHDSQWGPGGVVFILLHAIIAAAGDNPSRIHNGSRHSLSTD